MNSNGEFYIGRKKYDSTTGEEIGIGADEPADEISFIDSLLVNRLTVNKVIDAETARVTIKDLSVVGISTFDGDVTIKSFTDSTSCTTGALVVTGGVGIGKTVNICGELTVQRGININTSGIGVGDLGSSGGGDGIFGIYNTTNSGIITLFLKNSSGSYNGTLQCSFTGVGITGTLSVSGATTLSSTLSVGGNTSINGALTVTGDITAFFSSDERLKTNIKPIENSLEKILSISGNTFEWNENSDKVGNDTGVIAQEIQALGLPGLIQTRDNGYLAVDYQKLVPLLIESIKDLSNKVEKLESKINSN